MSVTLTPAPVAATEGVAFASNTLLATFNDLVTPASASVSWGDGQSGVANISTQSDGHGGYYYDLEAGNTYAARPVYNWLDCLRQPRCASECDHNDGHCGTCTFNRVSYHPKGIRKTHRRTLFWPVSGNPIHWRVLASSKRPLTGRLQHDGRRCPSLYGLRQRDGGPGPNSTFVVFGNHEYAEPGTYAVTVSILDNGGDSTVVNSTITVLGLAPTLTGISPTSVSTAGGAVLQLTGTDLERVSAVYFSARKLRPLQ